MAETPLDRKEVYNSISRFCNYQDRCAQEVSLKLKRLGVPALEVPPILCQLVEEDLVNEERFALNFARGKFRIKNWGSVRIRTALEAKGIAASHIAKDLDTIDLAIEFQTLHELASKKLVKINETNNQIRRKKLYDVLIYRGWEKELVYDKIRELIP